MMDAASAYIAARRAEGRLLDDATVAGLPRSGARTAHPSEWLVRERTLHRVLRTLNDRPRTILEVGCGNGWFAARLAEAGHTVTGIDLATEELDQARRVFAHLPITWLQSDPWSVEPASHGYDTVLFAASIQYFPDLGRLLQRCRDLLRDNGEVLIVDSPFYTDAASAAQARDRSMAHYTATGTPAMAAFYHHHLHGALVLAAQGARIDITPPRGKLIARLLGRGPFPIIRIRW